MRKYEVRLDYADGGYLVVDVYATSPGAAKEQALNANVDAVSAQVLASVDTRPQVALVRL